jgi:hypothetical protein
MMSLDIQIGARVVRKHDIGMDTPGAVVRLQDADAMVYWPTDSYYEVIPTEKLEPYGVLPVAKAVAA